MPSTKKRILLLALLLGVTFLAAQLHYCIDLTPQSSNTHFCPICSTAGHAIATTAAEVTASIVEHRFEVFPENDPVSVVTLRDVAPRGPPSA